MPNCDDAATMDLMPAVVSRGGPALSRASSGRCEPSSRQIVTACPAHVVTGCMADGSAAGQTYCRGDRAGKGEWSPVWNSEEHGGWLLE